jgi:hypothetical protein
MLISILIPFGTKPAIIPKYVLCLYCSNLVVPVEGDLFYLAQNC